MRMPSTYSSGIFEGPRRVLRWKRGSRSEFRGWVFAAVEVQDVSHVPARKRAPKYQSASRMIEGKSCSTKEVSP